eukprot:6169991-Pleurochrysis_carterae.AAC.1
MKTRAKGKARSGRDVAMHDGNQVQEPDERGCSAKRLAMPCIGPSSMRAAVRVQAQMQSRLDLWSKPCGRAKRQMLKASVRQAKPNQSANNGDCSGAANDS